MNKADKFFTMTAVALAFLAATGKAIAAAGTVDIYVNPTTWAFSHVGLPGDPCSYGNGTVNFANIQATGTIRGSSVTRYYFVGSFDVVNIRSATTCSPPLQTLSGCNNMFYIQGTAAFPCSNGYNGTGNGTTGEITDATVFSNGDLYFFGPFSSAGGWPYSSNLSCYRFAEGWSGVNGFFCNGQVTQFTGDPADYSLVVSGFFTWVSGPLYSGGPIQTLNTPSGTARWHDYYKAFQDGWWTQP